MPILAALPAGGGVRGGLGGLAGPYNIPHTGPCARGEGVSLFPVVCEHSDSVYGWQADPVIIA